MSDIFTGTINPSSYTTDEIIQKLALMYCEKHLKDSISVEELCKMYLDTCEKIVNNFIQDNMTVRMRRGKL